MPPNAHIETAIPMNYAILVDCDTISRNQMDFIFEKIRTLGGNAIVKRLYGEISANQLWQMVAADFDCFIVEAPCVVPGKTGVDSSLMMDAMELLFTQPIDGFCIVSSGADFTILASRLSTFQKTVIGFGMEHTPIPFVRSCGLFFHLDDNTASHVQPLVVNKNVKTNVKNKGVRPPPPKGPPPVPDGNIPVGWAAPNCTLDPDEEPIQVKIPIPMVKAPIKASHWRNLEPYEANESTTIEWDGE